MARKRMPTGHRFGGTRAPLAPRSVALGHHRRVNPASNQQRTRDSHVRGWCTTTERATPCSRPVLMVTLMTRSSLCLHKARMRVTGHRDITGEYGTWRLYIFLAHRLLLQLTFVLNVMVGFSVGQKSTVHRADYDACQHNTPRCQIT